MIENKETDASIPHEPPVNAQRIRNMKNIQLLSDHAKWDLLMKEIKDQNLLRAVFEAYMFGNVTQTEAEENTKKMSKILTKKTITSEVQKLKKKVELAAANESDEEDEEDEDDDLEVREALPPKNLNLANMASVCFKIMASYLDNKSLKSLGRCDSGNHQRVWLDPLHQSLHFYRWRFQDIEDYDFNPFRKIINFTVDFGSIHRNKTLRSPNFWKKIQTFNLTDLPPMFFDYQEKLISNDLNVIKYGLTHADTFANVTALSMEPNVVRQLVEYDVFSIFPQIFANTKALTFKDGGVPEYKEDYYFPNLRKLSWDISDEHTESLGVAWIKKHTKLEHIEMSFESQEYGWDEDSCEAAGNEYRECEFANLKKLVVHAAKNIDSTCPLLMAILDKAPMLETVVVDISEDWFNDFLSELLRKVLFEKTNLKKVVIKRPPFGTDVISAFQQVLSNNRNLTIEPEVSFDSILVEKESNEDFNLFSDRIRMNINSIINGIIGNNIQNTRPIKMKVSEKIRRDMQLALDDERIELTNSGVVVVAAK